MTAHRIVFSVSDHTGVTAEAFAHSLISQFEGVDATYVRRPFIDTATKLAAVTDEIAAESARGTRPIVFSTFITPGLQQELEKTDALVISLFGESIDKVAAELEMTPSAKVGSYHSIGDAGRYELRLDAVDFALMTDDGLGTDRYDRADVVLVGVSRTGKTPSCLYLSMQYGVRAANYALAIEDHHGPGLPEVLARHRDRLFGLTIEARRLHAIRTQRRPDSPYADLEACRREIAWTERLFAGNGIPWLDTTSRSIEEIAATILSKLSIARRLD